MAFTFEFDLEDTYTVTAHSVRVGHDGRGWDPPEPGEIDLGGPVRVWPGYGARQRKFGSMAEFTEWITFDTFIREVMLHHHESEKKAYERLADACLSAYAEVDDYYEPDPPEPYDD